jgi:hypothetical protein
MPTVRNAVGDKKCLGHKFPRRPFKHLIILVAMMCFCISPPSAGSPPASKSMLWIPCPIQSGIPPHHLVNHARGRLSVRMCIKDGDDSPPGSMISRRKLLFLVGASATGAFLPQLRGDDGIIAQAVADKVLFPFPQTFGGNPAKEPGQGADNSKKREEPPKQSPNKLRSELEEIKRELQADLQVISCSVMRDFRLAFARRVLSKIHVWSSAIRH